MRFCDLEINLQRIRDNLDETQYNALIGETYFLHAFELLMKGEV